jgi:hypothetical protein
MSETLTPSGQFWVRTIRAQARRAAKAHVWELKLGLAISIRDIRQPGTERWDEADFVARACGARASAYVALRDGNLRAARVCHAKSHRPVRSCA